MGPIEINVKINLGVTAELRDLVAAVLNNNKPQALSTEVAHQSTDPAPLSTEVEKKPKAEKTKKQPAAVPTPAEEPAPAVEEPAPAVEEPAAAPAQVQQEFTEEDVRAAMDRTRKRIEGENYKGNSDSEGYKQWHRKLTGWFKNTAAICGAEKPSALPDNASRSRFIDECDALQIVDGELAKPLAF